jgi:probable rRNA maturation factor
VDYGRLTPERATELCAAALSELGFELERVGEMSVALVLPETMSALNRAFRGADRPTDVLSFEVDGPYGEMVGEVVVCPQAASPALSVEELVVHGALHLAGMDHGEDFEGSEMSRIQETVMEKARGREG